MKPKDDKFKIRDRRGDNRYFIDNAFLKTWGAKLGAHCIAVYNVLVMHANADDQTAYPSFQTIADLTGMSRRQVVREIEKLKANNIISATRRTETHPETGKPYFLTDVFTLLHPDEWAVPGEQLLRESSGGSDSESLGVVTDSHQPSDSESPPLVTPSHLNNTHLNKTQETTKSAANRRPPTVLAYKVFVEEIGKNCLNSAQIKVIDKEVGTAPAALEKWRESVKAWNLNGNRPTDAAGMLDWFKTGKRSNYNPGEKAHKNGTHPPANKSSPSVPSGKLSTPIDKDLLEQLQAGKV